eukprot:SAG11_NODE_24967_length_365_cov_0.973684_1_plen_53_part_10
MQTITRCETKKKEAHCGDKVIDEEHAERSTRSVSSSAPRRITVSSVEYSVVYS